jgi:hypothetical protein
VAEKRHKHRVGAGVEGVVEKGEVETQHAQNTLG